MDAASRAELDALRVRAYGPHADIADDPAALARLIELESQRAADRLRGPGSPASPPPAAPASAVVAPAPPAAPAATRPARPEAPAPAAAPAPAPAPTPVRRGEATRAAVPLTRRTAVALAAVGGALILAIGGLALVRALLPPEPVVSARAVLAPAVRDARAAYSFAWDREAIPLLQIPLDGSFGRYIDLPSSTEVPDFPSTGTVEWAYPLGSYFGWEVWIAGASVDATGLQREHCILAERRDQARGRCVPAQVRAQSALLVSVPYASVAPEDRPVGMEPDERLGFWWNHDRAVTVILGDDP